MRIVFRLGLDRERERVSFFEGMQVAVERDDGCAWPLRPRLMANPRKPGRTSSSMSSAMSTTSPDWWFGTNASKYLMPLSHW